MENRKLDIDIDIGLQNAECLMMESPRLTNEQIAFVLRQQFLNLASHLVAWPAAAVTRHRSLPIAVLQTVVAGRVTALSSDP